MIKEVGNPTYKKDLEYAIKICRVFAQILGLWPTTQASVFQRIFTFFKHFNYYFFTLFIYVPSVLFGILILQDLHLRLLMTGPITFWTMLMSKYTLFWKRSKHIEKCLAMIEEDWKYVETEEYRTVMLQNAKFGRYISIICAICMYSGGFSHFVILPLTAETIVTPDNITIKPLPSPTYGNFLSSSLSPIYEIVFAMQVLSGFLNDTVNVFSFSFTAIMVIHACGQLDVVMMHLNNLVTGTKENQSTVHERFVLTVQHHLRVLRFISQLEDLLTEVCLIEVLGSTLIITLLGYYIIVAMKEAEFSDIFTYTSLIVSFTFNIFVYCYVGELLTIQGIKVGESAYMVKWYDLPSCTSVDLKFLIRIAQFPLKMTAGKFITLSLTSFSAIMRTAAAYFNFVRTMTE